MAAQTAPVNTRHLQIAPDNSPKTRSADIAPVNQTLGLIELDVALTKLAISKPRAQGVQQSRKTDTPKFVIRTASAPAPSQNGYGAAAPSVGDTTFFRWGQSHNKRSFALNADGSAQYMVKMGETIISIVECLLREKHRMFPSYEPSYREIRSEISSLRAANPDVQDLDLLHTGQWVTIPALVVCEALTGQGRLSA